MLARRGPGVRAFIEEQIRLASLSAGQDFLRNLAGAELTLRPSTRRPFVDSVESDIKIHYLGLRVTRARWSPELQECNSHLKEQDRQVRQYVAEQLHESLTLLNVPQSEIDGSGVHLITDARDWERAPLRVGYQGPAKIEVRGEDRLLSDKVTLQLGLPRARSGKVPARPDATRPIPPADLLDWEVLPPGWWNSVLSGEPNPGREDYAAVRPSQLQRILTLDELQPIHWYQGRSLGVRYYYVAVFARMAIAESPVWGNATYYSTSVENWQVIFRKSKREALDLGARRLIHRKNWARNLNRLDKG